MKNFLVGVAAATSLLSVSIAVGEARAEPAPRLIFGVDRAGEQPSLDRVQFIFGGRNFCWYDAGWQGPGFYWCGYAMRRGYGWGGGAGWHGWQAGGRGGRGGGYARGQVGRGGNRGGARVAAGHPAGATPAAAEHGGGHGGGDRKPGA